MKKSGVYKIINKVSSHFYVGSSLDIEKRWKGHRYDLLKNRHHSLYLQRAWDKYDEKSFNLEIIEECEAEDLIDREQHYIDTLHPQYNISPTAGSPAGTKWTPERRVKQSGKNNCNYGKTGEKHWNYGKPVSDETRHKISEAVKGLKNSDEHNQKIRETLKGKRHSEERKANESKAHIGYRHSEETKRKMSEARKRYLQLHKVGSQVNAS